MLLKKRFLNKTLHMRRVVVVYLLFLPKETRETKDGNPGFFIDLVKT
jgi:hypothetical protein